MAKRQRNKIKSDTVVFERADVAKRIVVTVDAMHRPVEFFHLHAEIAD